MYKVRGSDQKEYGPVSLEELRQWIAEGRLVVTSQLQAEGETEWKAAASFPELGGLFGAPPTFGPPSSPRAPAEKPKTSGLAIASLVLGILGPCTAGITALVGLILGIIALIKIGKSERKLGGQGFAIAGLVISGLAVLMLPILAGLLLPALAQAKAKAQTISCVNNMKQIGLGIRLYANDNGDKFPTANRWCDLVLNDVGSPKVFVCPSAQDGQRCHYAFNAKLDGKKDGEVDPQTVMIFETSPGWNKTGGKADLILRHRRTYVVGMADGSVQQVSEAGLSRLRWDP